MDRKKISLIVVCLVLTLWLAASVSATCWKWSNAAKQWGTAQDSTDATCPTGFINYVIAQAKPTEPPLPSMGCASSAECPTGTCSGGVCVSVSVSATPQSPSVQGSAGGACTADTACGSGLMCESKVCAYVDPDACKQQNGGVDCVLQGLGYLPTKTEKPAGQAPAGPSKTTGCVDDSQCGVGFCLGGQCIFAGEETCKEFAGPENCVSNEPKGPGWRASAEASGKATPTGGGTGIVTPGEAGEKKGEATAKEGYPNDGSCMTANPSGCYCKDNGRCFPVDQPGSSGRPGDTDKAPKCPPDVSCTSYVDKDGRTVVTTGDCPSGKTCYSDNGAYKYTDKDGKTHYVDVQPGACAGISNAKDCVDTGDGRHYICAAPCVPGGSFATAGEVADNIKYWSPPRGGDCGGGTAIRSEAGATVCEIVGDCPTAGYVVAPSCSRNLAEEQSYADFQREMQDQARIKGLQEGIAAGAAWGQMLSFITLGKIPSNIEMGWQTDLKQFMAGTGAGAWLSGRPEYSICYVTPDITDTVGMIMNPSGSGIGMWVKGEYTLVSGRPNETAPTQLYDLYIYKITLSVMPAGLTKNSGKKDCADKIDFYIKLQDLQSGAGKTQQIDFRQVGDPNDDMIELLCDGQPATYTGSSAIIWSSKDLYDSICLEFLNTDFNPTIAGALSGNSGKLCARVVQSGSLEDLGCTRSAGGISFDCPTAATEAPAASTAPAPPASTVWGRAG